MAKKKKVVEPEVVDAVASVREADEILPSESEEELAPFSSDESDSAVKTKSSSRDVVRYDPLSSYLAEIKNTKPLSREEEHELAVRFKQFGDQSAGYKMVVANLRLVVLIAREYERNFRNILDLVQEGNIGLLEAVKKYDPYRGVRFPSYAVYWIRAYMLRYLINNLRLVKVGTTQAQRKLVFNLKKEKAKLERDGFAPEAKLLAERLNVKESEVIEMEQRLALPDLSVDAPVRIGDEEGGDLHSVLSDGAQGLEDSILEQDFRQALREAVEEFKSSLVEREQAIIDERLFTEDPATLQSIADKYQLSRERVRQLETRLKKQLKEFLSDRLQLGDAGEIIGDIVEKE